MVKPVIGIIQWPYENKDDAEIFQTSSAIVSKISKHGGIPIGVFPTQQAKYTKLKMSEVPELTEEEKQDILNTLSICDGIIKPGANRIYDYERFIYDYAVEHDIPFLGICAGMQLMAHHGEESITNNIPNPDSHPSNTPSYDYSHTVKIERSSLLFNILGKDEIQVNSKHNFQISTPGLFRTSAYAEDSVIEAIEKPNQTFHLGVQWHPEYIDDENSDKIFNKFINTSLMKHFSKQ